MLVATSDGSLLGNMLAGKRVISAGGRAITMSRVRGVITVGAGQNFQCRLIAYLISKYNNIKMIRFNGVYSRRTLPKIKDGAYVINLGMYKLLGTC